MSRFSLSSRSWDRLRGVDPRLVGVVAYAITISEVDFTVLEGLRTAERQRELVAAGKSQTMNSRHLVGEAVDLGAWVDGKVSWDMEYYRKLSQAMEASALLLHVSIEWGGNWKTLRDGPHFQIPRG